MSYIASSALNTDANPSSTCVILSIPVGTSLADIMVHSTVILLDLAKKEEYIKKISSCMYVLFILVCHL